MKFEIFDMLGAVVLAILFTAMACLFWSRIYIYNQGKHFGSEEVCKKAAIELKQVCKLVENQCMCSEDSKHWRYLGESGSE